MQNAFVGIESVLMGSIHQAYCECGFSTDVRFGGARRTFRQDCRFPFYCPNCGIVSQNVANLPDAVKQVDCPECGSQGCVQYGCEPVSVILFQKKSWLRRLLGKEQLEMPRVIDCFGRKVYLDNNLCPSCRKMTMHFFSVPKLLFD